MIVLKKSFLIYILINLFLSSKELWALSYEKVVFKKEEPSYSIDVEYPKITDSSLPLKLKDTVNSTIKDFVYSLYQDDLESFSSQEWSEEDLSKIFGRNFVNIEFKVIRCDKDILSLRFEKYYYSISAVHGLTHIYGFNYDLNNKRIIELKDLFKPNTDYLKEISDYSIENLHRHLNLKNDAWIKKGASANEENFRDFGITENNLIIYFSDYQIASHEEGPQSVKIPFEKLPGITLN